MKYYRIDMHTIFDDCDYSIALAFADDTSDKDIKHECEITFNVYMCAFSKLLGDPASYSNIAKYEQALDYFVRNTDYEVTPINEEEFLTFENSELVEI